MAFYTPLLKSTARHLVMMKATSDPETDGSWVNVGDAVMVVPPNNDSATIESMWAFEHSSDIYVATQDTLGNVRLHIFDPGTDTWTTRNEKVVAKEDYAGDEPPVFPGVSVCVRSDGDVVVVFSNGFSGIEDDNLSIIIKETTWSTSVDYAIGSLFERGIALIGPDSSDRITGVHQSGNDNVRTRSVDSAGVLGTAISIDGTVDTADYCVGPGIIDSSDEVYIPYIDASNHISVGQWTSAANPSGDITIHANVGDNTVKGHGATSPPFVVSCLAVDGTDVHLLYADDTTQDIFHDADVDGGGTTDTEIEDAVTANRISCAVLSGNLDYVWLDGTTVKYGSESLATGLNPLFFLRERGPNQILQM